MIMKPKYATQRELRQIADRLEAVCVQSRLRVENIAVACPLCKTAAEELRVVLSFKSPQYQSRCGRIGGGAR